MGRITGSSHGPGWVQVYAPGTVGNLGAGFDILGLALNGIGDVVSARTADHGEVRIVALEGDDGSIPRVPSLNAAAIAAKSILDTHGGPGLDLAIDKGLPVSAGLGGSAASACAGAMAAALALGHDVDKDELVYAALDGERVVAGDHLDNIAPCMHGGVTLVHPGPPREIVSLPVPEGLVVVVACPPEQLDTRKARAAMPDLFPRATTVRQMAHVSLLVSALYEGDLGRLGRAFVDELAEPARLPLLRFGQALVEAARGAGALGATISGAGPTIVALADETMAPLVAKAMERVLSNTEGRVSIHRVDTEGTRPLEGATCDG